MSNTEFPRHFVAGDAVLDSWSTIEPYFDKLRDRPVDTVEALTQWLIDYSELVAAVYEVGTDRRVKMTCRTDDAERKAAFLDFIENIEPKCKPRCHELNVKFTQSPAAGDLPPDRFYVLSRSIRASVELFREENVALETEDAKLAQQYQELCGAQTVHFDGKEQTLQQLAVYAERTDRTIRHQALRRWRTSLTG